ncbi:glycosyltransferase family 39 protein [Alcaligenaceae bacterium]|nr:glycosyltransferase family 39 protein [Alcaligenaceae bacterium]
MPQPNKAAWLALAAILPVPLISMVIVPFYDTSEPRYAEIARVMAQTGDWITPWFSDGVPFWGKPPVSFWAQAVSMKMLGFTEFAGRFPSWLCFVLSCALLIIGLRPLKSARVAIWAAIIYSTCTLAYISSGAVLTDPFLALGTTLSLVSFARAAQGNGGSVPACTAGSSNAAASQPEGGMQRWRYGVFAGLAIGLLAKGPLAALIITAPITIWSLFDPRVRQATARLPWRSGLALVALVTIPWYIAAEIKTPGFIDYFFVGEHYRRFLDPGWAGDLYGSAHRRTYGTIWIYWLQASFPWGLLALAVMAGALRSDRLRQALRAVYTEPLFGYWLSSALFTPVFFTFSANILWTYLLPSLAGFSVLAAILAVEVADRYPALRSRLLWAAVLVPAVVSAGSAVMWIRPDLRNTERELVRYAMRQPEPSAPLFYLSELPFSARFYSAGRAREITEAELDRLVRRGVAFYLAIPKERSKAVMRGLHEPLLPVFSNKRFDLVELRGKRGDRISG